MYEKIVSRAVPTIAGIVAVLIFGVGSFYTIDQGERGVVLNYGKFSKISEPGLHFKIPIRDKVVKIPVRTITDQMTKIFAYSADQQPAEMVISITLSIRPNGVGDLYAQFTSPTQAYESAVVPRVKQSLKTVFGQFTAIRAVQHRAELNKEFMSAVTDSLAEFPYLDIQSVQIENIDFSDAYEQTIEDRMKAEVEVERFKQNLEREKVEAQIAVTRAQAQADSQVKAAEGEAKSITLKATAEADAIKKKSEALNANPSIINYMQVEKWDGKLPVTMLPNNTLPIINTQKIEK